MEHFNTVRYKTLIIICVLSCLFLFSANSFAGSKKSKRSLARKPFKVVLTGMAGDYPPGIKNRINQHPYKITEDTLFRMMNNFDYQKRLVTGWEKRRRRVFRGKMLKSAVKYLRAALLKVKRSQKVVFTNFTPLGETVCDIFIQREEINWKFLSIHGESRNMGMWMLMRGYLQNYYSTGDKLLSGQGLFFGGNYVDTGWMQIPLLQLQAEMKSDDKLLKEVGASGEKEPDDKKNKLEKLKKFVALFRKKLITKKELKSKGEKLMRERAGERLDIEEELEYLKLLKDHKIITRAAYSQRRTILLKNY